jgi:GNAT superfamily N-acetyltransferase
MLAARKIAAVSIVIRTPKAEDAEGLARAARDLGEQYARLEPERFQVPERDAQVTWYRETLRRSLPENCVWLVAEVDGEPVGEVYAVLHEPMANAAIQPQLDVGRRRVYLNYLAVRSEYQSQGIGGRLLSAVEAWARENRAELISTDTNLRSNVGAVEFYERNGFQKQAVVLRKTLA